MSETQTDNGAVAVLADKLPVVEYTPSDQAIAEFGARVKDLTCEGPAGYEMVRQAIATLRTYRGQVEKARVEKKADALAWGRKVDAEAKRITGLLLAIEEPLKARKQLVDDAKEKERRAAEDAERARVERERREQEAREALPDVEKVRGVATVLRDVMAALPAVGSARARGHLEFVCGELGQLAEACEGFGS